MKYIYIILSTFFSVSILMSQSMNLSHSGISPSSTLVVEPGENITFIYGGGGPHPMTSGHGSTESPVYFPTVTVSSSNPTANFSLTTVGTYLFHCGTNPGNSNLWGTIIVEATEPEYILGDVNFDEVINILDIVALVNHIIGTSLLDFEESGDMNEDGTINILDIVQIVNVIMGNRVTLQDGSAVLYKNTLRTSGSIGGLQFTGTLTSPVHFNDSVVSENGITVIYNTNNGLLSTNEFIFNDVPTDLIVSSSMGEKVEIVNDFKLMSIYPNPFNPQTTISYELLDESFVSLNIFDINGKLVKQLVNSFQSSNSNSVVWDGTNNLDFKVSSGVYLVNLTIDNSSTLQTVTLLK